MNANARTNANESSQNLHQTEESNVTTFYAFGDAKLKGEAAGLDDPFDFQPSMNLEDVHRGIIDHEQLNQFPNPMRKVSGSSIRAGFGTRAADQSGSRDQNVPTSSAVQGGSLLRRPSVNKYSLPQNRDATPRRRVSNAGNLTISTSSSTKYRTAIATIEPASSTRERKKPSSAVGASGSLGPPVPSKYHKPGGYSEAATEGGVKIPVSARNTKSKSLQPPPRQGQNLPLKPSLTPDHYRASVGFAPRSPRSPSTSKKIGTPGSTANRRISTIPHASGLAARTISPTDARRLKRLSMLNTPPPPSLPNSLEPVRSTPGSPSMIPRKSVTPSSQGTTPEPQRKSYSSGLSISSTSTSARTSTSSSQPKLAVNLVSSRLPRPPQLEREDDDIPPVPPLPKNLASPSEPQSGESSLAPSYDNTPVGTFKSSNSSLYGPRKSSLAPDRESVRSLDSDQALSSDSPTSRTKSSHSTVFTPRKSSLAPDMLGQPEPLEEPEIFDLENFEPIYVAPETGGSPKPAVTTDRETRRKRGMTLGGMGLGGGAFHMLENKASASSLRKKDLAPIRLPPLNLLPLSTPTIARVNALGPASDSEELTPPPQIGNRTPGTPMTASRATFFGRRDEGVPLHNERSMSSFNHSVPTAESPSSLSMRASSRASSSIPVSTSSRMGRQTISPYISSSLPRGASRTDNEAKGAEHKKTGMQMPGTTRVKSRLRKSQDSLKNAAPSDDLTDSPSTTTSIRRKLSLSWKKSSQGKNSHAATERAEEYAQGTAAVKFDNMPPPRLPTSSTWTASGAVSTPSPSKGLASQARRKGSVSNGPFGQHDRTRSDSWGAAQSPKKEKKVEEKPATTSKAAAAASSILSPMTKMLGNKGSLSHLRGGRQPPPPPPHNTDPNLDQDDLIAEEEIRKIASKRRNLDQAATQLDDLKRRAGPKERLSPQQVLRMGCLNIFEKGEIVDYKDVYFTGLADAKKHIGDLKSSSLPNFGYDDERGDYTIIKGDHLAYRYEIVDILGKGSFGQVVRCIDHRTGGLVAIKIIRNKKRFHQQALVEVNILQRLKEWVSCF